MLIMNRLVLFVILAVVVACPGVTDTKPGQVVTQSVIDCLKADREQLTNVTGEIRPLVFGYRPDWSAVYDKAKHAGKVVGGCVLADLVQEYLSSKKALPADASWDSRRILEEFRNNEAGGATFRTAHGDL